MLILEDQTDRIRNRMERWEIKEKLVKIQRKRYEAIFKILKNFVIKRKN